MSISLYEYFVKNISTRSKIILTHLHRSTVKNFWRNLATHHILLPYLKENTLSTILSYRTSSLFTSKIYMNILWQITKSSSPWPSPHFMINSFAVWCWISLSCTIEHAWIRTRWDKAHHIDRTLCCWMETQDILSCTSL